MYIKNIRKGDRIAVLAVVLIIVVALYAAKNRGGSLVVVSVKGEVYGTALLSDDETISLDIEGCINIIQMEKGEVSMAEANCPDGLCTQQRPVSRTGEVIICLPNKVMVLIEGRGEYDAISH